MFKKQKIQPMATGSSNETIIAQGVIVEGDFSSQGDVIIDGEVTGSVKTDQSLRIGESAKIHADISARTAIIAGEVEGNIHIDDRLELLESSRVHGDIQAQILSVAPGASVNGRITMGSAKKSGAKNLVVEESEKE